ncbi:hypothetical protein SASPL_129844 [Salvia splendens]|uniref:Uncharacterized protein n=1 Tax=Salvia splendens TaxID=180675 RepID=A0A8X8XDU8_SALSN|nr:hypothetical protein SASPL_129844 [Salvia splendens]
MYQMRLIGNSWNSLLVFSGDIPPRMPGSSGILECSDGTPGVTILYDQSMPPLMPYFNSDMCCLQRRFRTATRQMQYSAHVGANPKHEMEMEMELERGNNNSSSSSNGESGKTE